MKIIDMVYFMLNFLNIEMEIFFEKKKKNVKKFNKIVK